MKNKIYIFGPHDRFNYGDLLFPIMLEYAFKKMSNQSFNFIKASIVSSDLTELGGCKSISYKGFNKKIADGDIIIVAGGESLKAKWKVLYSFINKPYSWLVNRPSLFNFIKKIHIEKHLLGAKSEYPFCINKTDFKKNIKVFYNSVGGGRNLDSQLVKNLENSDYLAVRDRNSFVFLEDINMRSVYLVPDSAIILSDVFPIDNLLNADNKNTVKARNFLSRQEKYIFFQVSKNRIKKNINEIVNQLETLSIAKQCTILLCPIGTALGHEDHIALKKIFEKLNCSKHLVETPYIEDIITLLSQADLYIGSSLHGAITAMSYGVPYITLDERQSKISAYIKTWGLNLFDEMSSLDNFYPKATKFLEQSSYNDKILEDAKKQKKLYYESVERMLKLV